ncbi:DRC2 protein, partial [Chordeiles acutipennis]|nr:DRC2 protein [Chordeiles acutipennis]
MPVKRGSQAAAPMVAKDELLQSQALAEDQEAKGELLSRFLKDQLAKEQQSSTLNQQKLNAQWRALLREAKDKELRRDMEILSQTFARVMDCKDNSLVRDLEEAEEQHGRALRSHLHNVDRLLQLQRCRLMCLEKGFSAQLRALQREFEAERYR